MATSGSVRTNTSFGYVELTWSLSSQSVENNNSVVAYSLNIYRSSNISSTAAKTYSISINGAVVASGTSTIGGTGTKTIKSGSVTIPHKSDGTKTFAFSFSQQINITWSGTWIGTVTGNGSGTLTTIPRATTPTLSASSVDMGTSVTISMPRASSSFTHKLTYSFGASSGTIGNGLGTSTTWTPPVTLANQIPNATSGTGTITCETYSGSTLIGTKSISIVLKVPSSVVPVISSVAVTETVTSPNIAAKFGAFVQHKSKPRIVTSAAGANGSTIQTYNVYVRDSSNNNLAIYSGADVTAEPILISGTIKVVAQVTDSRGRSASVVQNITVLAYEPPKITGFTAFRCNSDGSVNYEGAYLNVSLNFTISTINNLNDKYYEVLYKVASATNWAGNVASGNIYSRNDSFVSNGIFNVNNAYNLKLQLYDFFDAASVEIDVPTAFTLIDFRSTGKGIAFGKVSEKDAMEIAMNTEITGNLTVSGKVTSGATPNVISVILSSNYTILANSTYEKIPFSSIKSQVGTAFTLSDGKIITSGLSHVKISGNARLFPSVTGTKFATVYLNDATQIAQISETVNASLRCNLAIPSMLVSVNDGDFFDLKVYGSVNDVIQGANAGITYLTIEAVD